VSVLEAIRTWNQRINGLLSVLVLRTPQKSPIFPVYESSRVRLFNDAVYLFYWFIYSIQ